MIQRFAALAFPAETDWREFAENHHFNTLPWPSLTVTDQQLEDIFKQFNLEFSSQPILGLCPGAEFGPSKRWPSEFYAETAEHYLKQGWAVWLFGSPKEQEAADLIMAKTNNRCVSFVGKTKLVEAIDLMSATSAIVSNDSGLMHIAAALKKPLVVVYGSSSPRFTPPLSDLARVLSLHLSCSPCFQRECPLGHMKCLKDLMPIQVITEIDSFKLR
jgi:heptosyltransferase II